MKSSTTTRPVLLHDLDRVDVARRRCPGPSRRHRGSRDGRAGPRASRTHRHHRAHRDYRRISVRKADRSTTAICARVLGDARDSSPSVPCGTPPPTGLDVAGRATRTTCCPTPTSEAYRQPGRSTTSCGSTCPAAAGPATRNRPGCWISGWDDERPDGRRSADLHHLPDALHRRRRHRGATSPGSLGGLEVVDEGAGGVLPHERTTPKASTDRLDLTRATRTNLSPVWGLSLADGPDRAAGRARRTGRPGGGRRVWSTWSSGSATRTGSPRSPTWSAPTTS